MCEPHTETHTHSTDASRILPGVRNKDLILIAKRIKLVVDSTRLLPAKHTKYCVQLLASYPTYRLLVGKTQWSNKIRPSLWFN